MPASWRMPEMAPNWPLYIQPHMKMPIAMGMIQGGSVEQHRAGGADDHLEAHRKERPEERPADHRGEGRIENLCIIVPPHPVIGARQAGIGEAQIDGIDERVGDDDENVDRRRDEKEESEEDGTS